MSQDPGRTRTHPGAAKHLPQGRMLAGRFRLGELLGAGGMGVVYSAHDEQLDLPVAVKLLRPELAEVQGLPERFRREIVLARQVSHRNVVRIHDFFLDGELPFLTMDLVQGRSLREVLNRGPLPVDRAVSVVRQLTLALEAAHQQGVIHRDLKPENILVEEGEEPLVRITDFGIARSIAPDAGGVALTETGSVLGTLDYLSPEQAAGRNLDCRSDLYTLGLIFHEMVTGALPFRQGTEAEMLAQRIGTSPSLHRLEDAPPWVRSTIGWLLQADPERRTSDAATLLLELDGAGSTGRRPTVRTARRPAVAVGIGLVVLVAAAGSVWWLGRSGRQDPGPEANLAAASAASRPAVAVLPLVDRTGDADLAWVARGAAEMLAQALATRPDLRVVDSLRVFGLVEDLALNRNALTRAQQTDLAELLDVDRLVLGSARREGTLLHLEIRLEAAEVGEEALLVVEQTPPEMLGAAIGRVAGKLSEQLDAGTIGQIPPALEERVNPGARAAYDRGVERLLRGDAEGALEALHEATEQSPELVAAWILISDAYDRQGRREEAVRAIRRASELSRGGAGRRALEVAARQADLSGQPEEAESHWRRLVDAYPLEVEARVHLAESVGDSGRLEEARRLLRQVVDADAKHPRAWYLLSKYAIQAGDLEEAVDETLVHALVIQNQLDNDPGRADVLNAMGVAYDRLGRSELARERYEEAAELRRRIGDLRGWAASLRNLGSLDAVQGDYAVAGERFDRAAEALVELGDQVGLASLASRRGILEEERGQVRGALALYRDALQIRLGLGDSRALAESYNHVGFAYYLLGEYDNARVYWSQALDELRAHGNRQGEVFVRQNLGLLQLARGQWSQATRSFVESLAVGRELGLPDVTAAAHGYLGRIAHLQGRFAVALDSYEQSLVILEELGDPRGLAEFGLLRAEALFDLGAFEEAAGSVERAVSALEEAPNSEQGARLAALQARLAIARDDLAAALDPLARAERLGETGQSVLASWEARWARAGLLEAQGDEASAARLLAELAREADRLGHLALRFRAAEQQGRVELARGRSVPAREAFGRGLAVLRPDGEWKDRFRLHAGLSRALEAEGDLEAAEREREAARAELARLRAEIEAPYLARFDAQAEVRSLE